MRIKATFLALLLTLSSGYCLPGIDRPSKLNYEASLKRAPAPKLKPILSRPLEAGRLRRLSLHSFSSVSQEAVRAAPPANNAQFAAAPLPDNALPIMDMNVPIGAAAQMPRLNQPLGYEHIEFTNKLAGLAENGPLKRQKHNCAASSKTIKSLGMERQITETASLGVEYVYKEKCHAKSMATLTPHDLPSETGIKLRVSMRF